MADKEVLDALDWLRSPAPRFDESAVARYRRGYDRIDWSGDGGTTKAKVQWSNTLGTAPPLTAETLLEFIRRSTVE